MAREGAAPAATCGLPELDSTLGGLLRGDNVLWTAEGPRCAEPFYRAVTQAGDAYDAPVYVTHTDSPQVVTARLPRTTVLDARPGFPLAEPAALLHHLNRRAGQSGRMLVLFDPLESLVSRWGQDQAGRFVSRCMVLLLDRDAVGYWSVQADQVPVRLYQQVQGQTQCALTVDRQVIRVTKAEGRPAEALGTVLSYELRHGLPTGVGVAPPARRLATALRTVRRDRGLTQHQVGELAGVSASAISQAERGQRGLSFATLLTLTERLGITIEQMLSPCSGEGGYRVGRRHPITSGRPTLDGLLPPDHEGHGVSVVRLPAGRSLALEPERAARVVLIVAAGIVEVTTPVGRSVLRGGDVMTTTPADQPVTALRDLGPGSTIFLVG